MNDIIGFDADGVLLDSRDQAFKVATGIRALLGANGELAEQGDFGLLFGVEALAELVGHHRADALRATHRLAMLRAAGQILRLEDTLAVVARQVMPCVVITAAYAEGVSIALGHHARIFQSITGFEAGRKSEIMATFASRLRVYVTDSISDLRICQRLGVPTIAVAGGYDKAEDLSAAGADHVASTPGELEEALAQFHPQQTSHMKENSHELQ